MGGHAFNLLNPGSFPRIPTTVYQPLKAHFQVLLQALYVHVGVPTEAPEKLDHGDLDFIVCTPTAKESLNSVNAPHNQVKAALGATHCVLVDGNQTSNFAVPVSRDAWSSLDQEEVSRQVFHQVKVDFFTRLYTIEPSIRLMCMSVRIRTNGTVSCISIHMVISF